MNIEQCYHCLKVFEYNLEEKREDTIDIGNMKVIRPYIRCPKCDSKKYLDIPHKF